MLILEIIWLYTYFAKSVRTITSTQVHNCKQRQLAHFRYFFFAKLQVKRARHLVVASNMNIAHRSSVFLIHRSSVFLIQSGIGLSVFWGFFSFLVGGLHMTS